MTFDQKTRQITRLARLQNQLLDHTGHVARGVSRDNVRVTLDEIQRIRTLIGWEPLDMSGRYRRRGGDRNS